MGGKRLIVGRFCAGQLRLKKQMEKRKALYEEALLMIKESTPQKESILYHNIFSLKVNGFYPFSSKQDVLGLVNFLNTID